MAENEPVVFTKARAEGKSEELTPFVGTWTPYAPRVEGKVRDTCCPGNHDGEGRHSPKCWFGGTDAPG